jgi:pimeloyl-ACP methyl ester carboxylesterase
MTDADVTVRERTVATNGVELHVLDAGPEDGLPVLLAHGFPELAYSWRHQIPVLAASGFRVLAPDQRGYGQSTRPEALDDYDILHLTGDLNGLLDDIGAAEAIFVGHDWGALVVWQHALLYPERVAGVVGMSVPFIPRGELPPVQFMRQVFADSFFYIVYFQEPGVADADLARDPATTMRRLLAGVRVSADDYAVVAMSADDGRGFVERLPEPEALPDWLTQDELDVYVEAFRRTGFTGGINWYRNMDRNWSLMEHLEDAKVTMPSLFVGGRLDPVIAMTPPSVGHDRLTDHRGDVIVEGAGHWVQQESADEVNAALLGFCEAVRTERATAGAGGQA